MQLISVTVTCKQIDVNGEHVDQLNRVYRLVSCVSVVG